MQGRELVSNSDSYLTEENRSCCCLALLGNSHIAMRPEAVFYKPLNEPSSTTATIALELTINWRKFQEEVSPFV